VIVRVVSVVCVVDVVVVSDVGMMPWLWFV